MLRSKVGQRLLRVLSAQALNQIVTILVQLSLVPVLLKAWGVEQYGVWLILSAIPTYLTFSDFGFTLIAKNEMTMSVAANDRRAALTVFQSVLSLLNCVAPLVISVTGLVLWLSEPSRILNIAGYSDEVVRAVLLSLIANVLVYQYFLLLCAGVRCENRAATESTWAAAARLADGVLIGLVAITGGGLLCAALASLLSRVAFSIAMYLWLRSASPWLKLGMALADRRVARRLMHPAFAFMMMPISQALLLQGPVLILGHQAGPLSVVVYSATRTLTRVGTAGTNLMNASLIAEYSALFGQKSIGMLRKLIRLHFGASVAITVLYGAALGLLCKPLMFAFTHGRVAVELPFFGIMIMVVMAEMVWSSFAIPLSAINRHVSLSHALLISSVLGLATAATVLPHAGMSGVAICLLLVHATMVLVVCRTIRKQLPAGIGHSPIAGR